MLYKKFCQFKYVFFTTTIMMMSYNTIFAQNKNEIDAADLLLFAKQKFNEKNYTTALEKSNDAIYIINNDKSPIKRKAYLYAAKSLIELGLIKKALEYIQIADENNNNPINYYVKIEAHRLRGKCFNELKLEESALKEFRKQLYYSDYIKNKNDQILSKYWSYQSMVNVFQNLRQNDSLKYYLQKQSSSLNKIKSRNKYNYQSETFQKWGEYYAAIGNFTKAENYFEHAISVQKKANTTISEGLLLSYAKVEIEKNNPKNAIKILEKALQNSVESKNHLVTYQIYYELSNLYIVNNNDFYKARQYLLKAKETKDIIEKSNTQVMDIALQIIIKDKEREHKDAIKIIIFFLLIGGVMLCLVLIYCLNKYNKKNKKIITDHLHDNSENKNTTTLQEEKKDSMFTELLELAKSNNPQFLILFKEMYPGFIQFIKTMDPKVRSSELTFLSMTYLNFSTKDISEYTYVTVRAVQIRKNRLRKKYNIPSDEDFNSWMRINGSQKLSEII